MNSTLNISVRKKSKGSFARNAVVSYSGYRDSVFPVNRSKAVTVCCQNIFMIKKLCYCYSSLRISQNTSGIAADTLGI